MSFCEEVGLPITLAQIGLGKVTDKQLMDVATAACAPGETIHNAPCEVTPKRVLRPSRLPMPRDVAVWRNTRTHTRKHQLSEPGLRFPNLRSFVSERAAKLRP